MPHFVARIIRRVPGRSCRTARREDPPHRGPANPQPPAGRSGLARLTTFHQLDGDAIASDQPGDSPPRESDSRHWRLDQEQGGSTQRNIAAAQEYPTPNETSISVRPGWRAPADWARDRAMGIVAETVLPQS